MAKIIFCEDEMRIQKLVLVMLRGTSHEVYLASDGVEGLALIERILPDLIFSDVSMPRCDGFQLADAVRAQPHLAHIPIIFVTAFAQRTEMEEGYHHGAIGYLTKPFSPAALREKIDAFAHAESLRS